MAAANSPAATAAKMIAPVSSSRLPLTSDSGPANSSDTASGESRYTFAYTGNNGFRGWHYPLFRLAVAPRGDHMVMTCGP